MPHDKMIVTLNAFACLLLAYLCLFSDSSPGYAEAQTLSLARLVASAYLFVFCLSLITLLETAIVRAFSAKILACFHFLFLLASLYSFLQAMVFVSTIIIHSLLFFAFVYLIVKGPGLL